MKVNKYSQNRFVMINNINYQVICFEYISRDFIGCFHTFRLYTNYVLCFQGFGKVYEAKKYGLSCTKTSWLANGYDIKRLYILLHTTIYPYYIMQTIMYVAMGVCIVSLFLLLVVKNISISIYNKILIKIKKEYDSK